MPFSWVCFLLVYPGERNFSFYIKPKGLPYLRNPSAFPCHISQSLLLPPFCRNNARFLSQHLSPFITFFCPHVSPPPRLCFWKASPFFFVFPVPCSSPFIGTAYHLFREWWARSYENVGFDSSLSYGRLFKSLVQDLSLSSCVTLVSWLTSLAFSSGGTEVQALKSLSWFNTLHPQCLLHRPFILKCCYIHSYVTYFWGQEKEIMSFLNENKGLKLLFFSWF